jgi:hexosaminidase
LLLQLFPNSPLFLGGDEVQSSCWGAATQIAAWLKSHNMTVDQLQAYYEEQLVQHVAQNGSDVVFWQEVFQNAPNVRQLPSQSIISVWKGASPDVLGDVVRAGLRAVSSGAWYLDMLNMDTSWGREWKTYYTFDPQVRRAKEEGKGASFQGCAAWCYRGSPALFCQGPSSPA